MYIFFFTICLKIDYEKLPLLCESYEVVMHSIDKYQKDSNGHGIAHFVEDTI